MKYEMQFTHFHLFCGLGAAAKGVNRAKAQIGNMHARFRCVGGVDSDPNGIADFSSKHFASVKGTVLDLFDREQYIAFHGRQPPLNWREATPADLRAAASGNYPDVVILSPPCKGFSGLLAEQASLKPKYQALNRLTIRGVMLALEAWKDNLPVFWCFENVPRIQNRGRKFLDQIIALLQAHGYSVAETTHDCGELGGLAQSRKRFLLVARLMSKVPSFLYEPPKRSLMSVGSLLGRMMLPGDANAGPMHVVPKLAWKTWLRLAFVKAGSDWRSLNDLKVDNGVLRDFQIEKHKRKPNCPMTFCVSDPSFDHTKGDYGQYGVCGWNQTMGAVINVKSPGQGKFAVADPRMSPSDNRHYNLYRVIDWAKHANVVTGSSHVGGGAMSIADPRSNRIALNNDAEIDDSVPTADEKCAVQIISTDGSWHRPFTTLELAVLQNLVEPDGHLELAGKTQGHWRERIGNAIPPAAFEAVGSVMLQVLLLTATGQTRIITNEPVWAQPIAAGIMMSTNYGIDVA